MTPTNLARSHSLQELLVAMPTLSARVVRASTNKETQPWEV